MYLSNITNRNLGPLLLPKQYLSALTTLRFVAAAMIVIHHVEPYFRVGASWFSQLALDQGVSFFFVLSGFILFYRHGEITTTRQSLDFLAARVARIWPLHAASFILLLLFVANPWGPAGPALGPLVTNLLLLQSWIPLPGYFFSYNAVSWSLSTELFFYVVYPILSRSWRKTWRLKVFGCLCLAILMVWVTRRLGLGFYDGSPHVSIDAMVYINPVARVFEFALGMAAAEIWLRLRPDMSRLPRLWATLLEAMALVMVYEAMTWLKDQYGALYAHGEISAALLKWLITAGSAPCFAILVVIFAAERGLLSRILSWHILVVLGETSFALYLFHQILFRALVQTGSLAVYGRLDVQFAIYCLFVLGLSYATHMLIERPCQRAMLNWLRPVMPG
jgi:peptidoglycan/LPS O-acetylase OafA/YrhL